MPGVKVLAPSPSRPPTSPFPPPYPTPPHPTPTPHLQLASPNLTSALFALLRSLDVHFRLRLGLPVLAHGESAHAPVVALLDTALAAAPAPAPTVPSGTARPPSRMAHQDSRVARSRVKALATLAAEHDGRVAVCVVALQAVQSLRLLCTTASAEVVTAVEVRLSLCLSLALFPSLPEPRAPWMGVVRA